MTRPEDDRAPAKQAPPEADWSYLDSHDELWTALAAPRIDMRVVQQLVRRKR